MKIATDFHTAASMTSYYLLVVNLERTLNK